MLRGAFGSGRCLMRASLLGCAGLVLAVSCGSAQLHETPRSTFRRLTFPGVGPLGIFDPSLAMEPGQSRVWMSYSTVEPSYRWTHEHPHTIGTRLAFSEDGGSSWVDAGVAINRPEDVTAPFVGRACGARPCTWNFEVSRLVYDAGAPLSGRWKIFYHRYLLVNGDRDFRLGWIGMKEAPTPTALAKAPEAIIMVGSLLDETALSGAFPLPVASSMASAGKGLRPTIVSARECLVVTEAGFLASGDDAFLVVHCASGMLPSSGEIVLYRLDRQSNSWERVGPLLDNAADGAALHRQGIPAVGFSAPDLVQMGETVWLSVTPTFMGFPSYRGCYFFRVEDLSRARLARGAAGVRPEHVLVGRSHHGACAALAGAPAAGVLLSELHPEDAAPFQIFATGMHL